MIDDWVSPVEDLPSFHCYVKHDVVQGQPYALSMHPTILRRIATDDPDFKYVEYYDLGRVFGSWLFSKNIDCQHVCAAGKNFAAFDLQFLKHLNGFIDKRDGVHFKHRFYDPGMLWLMPGDTEPPNTKLCMERAGIPGEVAHTAVEDARVVIRLVRIAMEEKARLLELQRRVLALHPETIMAYGL